MLWMQPRRQDGVTLPAREHMAVLLPNMLSMETVTVVFEPVRRNLLSWLGMPW